MLSSSAIFRTGGRAIVSQSEGRAKKILKKNQANHAYSDVLFILVH